MRWLLILLLTTVGVPVCGAEDLSVSDPPSPVRVLLLSGQNNHDWRQTTPRIKWLLESNGPFKVDVHQRPDQLTTEALKPYDVIVSNWNTFVSGKNAVTKWPEATRNAYLDFVHGGKGHVVIHAGSSSFPEWPEYQELTLASWKMGQTGHGPQHAFTVRMGSVDHPITSGLADFETHDELWHRAGVQKGVTVLASAFSAREQGGSGQDEPVAMIGRVGQGRSFTLLLGHGIGNMKAQGFASLLARGTQWAASGHVTLDAAK